jgi:DNA-binding NarL/FixJ family response regulator
LGTLSIRVLLVDDFEPFRRFVTSILQKQPELQIICEVSDGLEAVRKATELQPDLILLDISLPHLHGIEAASRIRQVAPDAKILFVSQIHDAGVVQAALNSGALGYVLKADTGSDLLPAIEVALRGDKFVSKGLKD